MREEIFEREDTTILGQSYGFSFKVSYYIDACSGDRWTPADYYCEITSLDLISLEEFNEETDKWEEVVNPSEELISALKKFVEDNFEEEEVSL